MKSIAELTALRDQMKNKMGIRHEDHNNIKIVVGMATCGIAAGARPVLVRFADEVAKYELQNVTVAQSGSMSAYQCEPLVEVTVPGQETVTYVKVTPEMAARIVSEHIVGGKPVTEFTANPSNK